MVRDPQVFAKNLTQLMNSRGLRNADLARKVPCSRQMVANWRNGKSLPRDTEADLIAALECQLSDLYQNRRTPAPAMLPLAQWAEREGIPISRAQSLFELGFLKGATGAAGVGGKFKFAPADVHAPPESKKLVRTARRPTWVLAFQVNLDRLMRASGMTNAEMGLASGVIAVGVVNWRSGRSFPKPERLEDIARPLGCTVDELTAPPSQKQIAEWRLRYARKSGLHEAA